MINSIYAGELVLRVFGGVCFKGSFEFELLFSFALVCRFSCHVWFCGFFPSSR
jgi:hypothetical protein